MFGFSPEEQWALTLTTFAGLSTSLGGILAIVRRPDDTMLAFLLGTAIGVMVSLSVIEMWIHNAVQHGWPGVTFAVLCGALLYRIISPLLPDFDAATELTALGGSADTQTKLLDRNSVSAAMESTAAAMSESNGSGSLPPFKSGLVPRRGDATSAAAEDAVLVSGRKDAGDRSREGGDVMPSTAGAAVAAVAAEIEDDKELKNVRRSAELLRLGFLMAVTMTLHNAPEGFAVAFSSFTDFGPVMAAAIAIHNIPEGYIISVPIFLSTGSRWKALAVATLSGLSEPAGALCALLLGRPFISEESIHYVMAFVGGIMSAVSVLELWPEGRKCKADDKLWAGIVAGGVVMAWTLWMGI